MTISSTECQRILNVKNPEDFLKIKNILENSDISDLSDEEDRNPYFTKPVRIGKHVSYYSQLYF